MRNWKVLIYLIIIVTAVFSACLGQEEAPLDPSAVVQGNLTISEGYTSGTVHPIWGYLLGEFSSFTMRWTEDPQAVFYEVRASEEPITTENWNRAVPMSVINAPADTANVFVQVEVETEPCIGCGLCEGVCPMEAISVQGGVAVIDYDLCTSCGQCQDICPVDAISGTRFGKNYFFGIRAFYGEGNPSEDISVSDQAYRLVYFNAHSTIGPDPGIQQCQRCEESEDSLGCYGGCYVLSDYKDEARTVFTGFGCPVDAIWQDTIPVGDLNNMIYIDYNLCISCGQCLLECWNYEERINPDPNAYIGFRSFKRRVVPADWVPEYPARP